MINSVPVADKEKVNCGRITLLVVSAVAIVFLFIFGERLTTDPLFNWSIIADAAYDLNNDSAGHRSLADVRSAGSRKPGEVSAIRPLFSTGLSASQHRQQSLSQQAHVASVEKVTPPSSFSSWFGGSKNTHTTHASSTQLDVRHHANFVSQPAHTSAKHYNKQAPSEYNRTLSSTGDTSKLTKEQCKAKYGERHYLPLEQKKFPPMLYTFPGSGNTWCRLLIEYGTGIYSGSVYNDQSLLHSLPGEFTCNWQVSVIKIHPHTHPFEGLRTGVFNSDANKCKRGGVDKIRRAILLIRDPYDSIWSEFQRRITQSHVGGVLKANFNWPRWQANAAALSHAYNLMWAVHHAGIEQHFARKDILYLKYEDLKNKATRVDTLMKVAQFLDISTPSREQLECAFMLADNRETHRTVDAALTMSKDEAYTHPLACRMWALFGTHAAKHGYKVWHNYDCSKNFTGPGIAVAVDAASGSTGNVYPPIPRVNVGPQGEYDRKWVKPGASLLDFGGHPTSKTVPAPATNGIGGGGNGAGMHGKPNGAGKKGPGLQKKVPGNKPQKPGATIRPRPAEFRGGTDTDGAGGPQSAPQIVAAAAPVPPVARTTPTTAPKFRLVTPMSPAETTPAAPVSTGTGVLSGALASASDIAAAIARTFQPATTTADPVTAASSVPETPAAPAPATADGAGNPTPAVAEWGSGGGGLGLGLGKKGRGGKKKGQGFGSLGGIGGGGAGLGGGAGKKRAARSPMDGMFPVGAESTTANQQQLVATEGAQDAPLLRKDKQRGAGRGGKMRSQAVTGMSLEQASQKDAVIAAVGADKPAWQ